jgi:transposase-like protein
VVAVDAFLFFDYYVSSPVRFRADRRVNSAHRLFILGARKDSVLSRWRHQRLNSLDEASQWTSVRATNAIERLHEEFKRRITRKPSCQTPKPPLWTLLASAQIVTHEFIDLVA